MSAWTKEQRAIAAAHLCDIAARLLRSGDYMKANAGAVPSLLVNAKWLIDPDANPSHYADGLRSAGLSPVDINAAVADILRGSCPSSSLPGMVATCFSDAMELAVGPELCVRDLRAEGAASAFRTVLTMLGYEVPK